MERIKVAYVRDNQDWVGPHLNDIMEFGKLGLKCVLDDGAETILLADKSIDIPSNEEQEFIEDVMDMKLNEVKLFDQYDIEVELVGSIHV